MGRLVLAVAAGRAREAGGAVALLDARWAHARLVATEAEARAQEGTVTEAGFLSLAHAHSPPPSISYTPMLPMYTIPVLRSTWPSSRNSASSGTLSR